MSRNRTCQVWVVMFCNADSTLDKGDHYVGEIKLLKHVDHLHASNTQPTVGIPTEISR